MEFDGKNLHELSFRELSTKMAVVLTERMKPELMTCRDIVATARYTYTGRLGMLTREDEEKVEKAMRAVHAKELGGRDFNAISDGQRQRVLLARAICQEPEVIILDEPTSFLDIRHKLELLAILRRMAKEKGINVGLVRPITVWPFPYDAVREACCKPNVKGVLDVELNEGQMLEDVKLAINGAKPVDFFGHCGSQMPSTDEIVAKILSMKEGK